MTKQDKPLTAKQASFVQYFADSGSSSYNNGYQSAIRAGYSENYADRRIKEVLGNVGVKQAISEYKQEITAELDHNRTIAIQLLTILTLS
jgi:phage terminase small subunit